MSLATRATFRWTLVAAALASLALAGCGTSQDATALQKAAREPAAVTVADPTAITIPAIGAHSSLEPLGLTPEGALEVPPVDAPMQAGWYAGSKKAEPGDEIQPGEPGNAVVAAHVDGVIDGKKGQPGLFFKLHELKPGDEILVDRADASQARFIVDRVEKHAKDEFPTSDVFAAGKTPQLVAITCGGPFNHAARSYEDNWIVWAHLDRETFATPAP